MNLGHTADIDQKCAFESNENFRAWVLQLSDFANWVGILISWGLMLDVECQRQPPENHTAVHAKCGRWWWELCKPGKMVMSLLLQFWWMCGKSKQSKIQNTHNTCTSRYTCLLHSRELMIMVGSVTTWDICRNPCLSQGRSLAGCPGCPMEARCSKACLSMADWLQRCHQEPLMLPAIWAEAALSRRFVYYVKMMRPNYFWAEDTK